jgi:aminopeptidase N
VDKLDYAMYSLKTAMKWDEDAFGTMRVSCGLDNLVSTSFWALYPGLECDLENYNIVAVNDFNMGAMENKGLNVFNTQFVLAKPSTATDVDYEHILGVIGHEYFHNWYGFRTRHVLPAVMKVQRTRRTGNRVTCRDWFQLTLKEGLTVFRYAHQAIAYYTYALMTNIKNCTSLCCQRSVIFLRHDLARCKAY